MSDNDYFSRENRLARRARRLAEFDTLSGTSHKAKGKLTTQNAGQHAVQVARDLLNSFRMPSMPKLSYSGIRNAKTAQSSSKLEDGVVTVFAEIRTISGVNVGFDIPMEIREGELMDPSVVVIDGAPRIIAQSTFDDLVERSTMYDLPPVRELYSAPIPQNAASDAYGNRMKMKRVNTGLFSLGANVQALKDAVAGKNSRLAAVEDYDADDKHEKPDHDRNHQDDDWLDPAERYHQHDLHVGQEVSLKEALEVKERGGAVYDLPKGAKCKILRDHAGDNKSFVVRFEDESLEAIVERHFLAKAAQAAPQAKMVIIRVGKDMGMVRVTDEQAFAATLQDLKARGVEVEVLGEGQVAGMSPEQAIDQHDLVNQISGLDEHESKITPAPNSDADGAILPPEEGMPVEEHEAAPRSQQPTKIPKRKRSPNQKVKRQMDPKKHGDADVTYHNMQERDMAGGLSDDHNFIAKVNEEVGGLRDQGLSDVDIKHAVFTKYGPEVAEKVFA